jgi:hypothetical protein
MMTSPELHPIARDLLRAFAPRKYFRSNRLALTLAERAPNRCIGWAISLVEPTVDSCSPHEVVSETLIAVHDAVEAPSADKLPRLDELAWKSWSSGSFDDSLPYLQRAVARLGWAAMCLIWCKTDSAYESRYTAIGACGRDNWAIAEMANQCAMALDMTFTDNADGRLMVASSFSREMDTIS